MAKKAVVLKNVEIELIRSVIGCKPNQRATMRALGLGKIGSKRTVACSPQISGMLCVVNHLIRVKELS